MPFCTQCGVEIQERVNYCPECGAKMMLNEDKVIDPAKSCKCCGALMPVDMFYCLNCGNPFDDEN